MLTPKQKRFGDELSRDILIYSIEQSRHKDNEDLKRFIRDWNGFGGQLYHPG